ncbi:MAG: Response regulator with domain [Actinomycetia bacterium]|nr:Response regulator with domain [Actinomycetes bacterium]
MERVLVVDDDEQVRSLLGRFLGRRGYVLSFASSPAEALDTISGGNVDLVLSDVKMPGGSGIQLLETLRERNVDVPVVMVSGVSDPDFADTALALGASGYVTKPFDASQVLIAAANAIRRGKLERENRSYREGLELMVDVRTRALTDTLAELQTSGERLQRSTEFTVQALAQAIDGRDVETGHHVIRVSRYATVLAAGCGFDADGAHLIGVASAMHDIGKVGVPDGILFKPGPFTRPEFDVIKQHSELGFRILSKSEQPLLATAASIAYTHHERWDGSGYPNELAGQEIPMEGRIAAVADVFDAVVSRRCYKPAYPVEHAYEILRDGRETDFYPGVVDAFFDNVDAILEIKQEYADD